MKDALGELAGVERQGTVSDALIRWAATGSVAAVTVIAAVISYGHARDLVLRYGVTGRTADFLPLTVDGLVATCSLILVDCARHNRDAPWQAWVLPFNPAYGVILNFRQAVLGGDLEWYALAVSGAVSVGLFVAGCLYFRRVERGFADLI